MKFSFLKLGVILIISLAYAQAVTYSDCSVYGNCKATITTTTAPVNYSLVNVNNSQYLQGYQWSNAPYPSALYSTFNATYATWAYNQTTPALNYRAWNNYNASVGTYIPGFGYSVPTMSAFYDGLVGWWRMEQGNGTFFSDYMGRNNGTCSGTGCPVFNQSGRFGGSYGFDGVNDYFNVSSLGVSTVSGTNVTVSLWLRMNKESGTQIPFSWSAYDLAYISGNLGFNSYASDNWGVTVSGFQGNWKHIVAIFANDYTNKSRLFINGVEQTLTQKAGSSSSKTVSSSAWIGSYTGAFAFNGSIDEVMIFNRSLSAGEIAALYNSSQYALYKNNTNLNQSLNYTMFAYDGNQTTECIDNQCPASGNYWTYTNSTLNFEDTVLFAKDYRINSLIYNGNALSLISKIKTKSSNSKYLEIDYKESNIKNGEIGFSTILKAVIELIEKIANIESENNKIKACTKNSKGFADYKLCIGGAT